MPNKNRTTIPAEVEVCHYDLWDAISSVARPPPTNPRPKANMASNKSYKLIGNACSFCFLLFSLLYCSNLSCRAPSSPGAPLQYGKPFNYERQALNAAVEAGLKKLCRQTLHGAELLV